VQKEVALVTLLSQPSCGPCIAWKAAFKKHEIEYDERNVREDPEALALAKELGYQGTPVVIAADGRHIGAFEPDFLATLK